MDPGTLALVGVAVLVAALIKRGSRPAPAPMLEPEPAYASARPSRLDRAGLRPAVTEREEAEGKTEAEAAAGAGGGAGRFFLLGRVAEESGSKADVIGGGERDRGSLAERAPAPPKESTYTGGSAWTQTSPAYHGGSAWTQGWKK